MGGRIQKRKKHKVVAPRTRFDPRDVRMAALAAIRQEGQRYVGRVCTPRTLQELHCVVEQRFASLFNYEYPYDNFQDHLEVWVSPKDHPSGAVVVDLLPKSELGSVWKFSLEKTQ